MRGYFLITGFLIGCSSNMSMTTKEEKKENKKDKSCMCIKIYEPVCAPDGTTYGNECEARCEGVKNTKDGPCSI